MVHDAKRVALFMAGEGREPCKIGTNDDMVFSRFTCRVLARRHHCGIVAALLWESSLLGVAAAIAAASIRICRTNKVSSKVLQEFTIHIPKDSKTKEEQEGPAC